MVFQFSTIAKATFTSSFFSVLTYTHTHSFANSDSYVPNKVILHKQILSNIILPTNGPTTHKL